MNKKGIAETIIDYTRLMINLGLVIIVSIFIVAVAFKFLNTEYRTNDFEAKLLARSLITADNCLSYSNGVDVNQGLIDLNKFSDERLKICFSSPRIGYVAKLLDLENNQLAIASPESKLLDFLPICSSLPEYKCTEKYNYVLYYKDNEIKPGIL